MLRLPHSPARVGFFSRKVLTVLGLAFVVFGPSWLNTARADKTYLSLTGITGEVTASGYENTIAVASFSMGAQIPITMTTSGTASASDTVIIKLADTTTPFLFDRLCKGQRTATAKLIIARDDGSKRMEYEFANAGFSSLATSGSGGNTAIDSLSFVFDSVIVRTYNAAGTLLQTKGWSFKTNSAI